VRIAVASSYRALVEEKATWTSIFLVEELSLFGIQFQVWHFGYLAIAAVAVIYARMTER
jgi:hypothetical protein